jgi:hypothetical protein
MGVGVQDVGMALGSGQGEGLEAAVKGKKKASGRGRLLDLKVMV